MLSYLALLIVATILAVRSVKGLITNRFPHPSDLATLSIFYYAVPLSMAAWFSFNYRGQVFLSPAAADAKLGFESLGFATLAMVMLIFGRLAGSFVGLARLKRYFTLGPALIVRLQAAYVAMFAIIAIGILLFGVNEFLAGYAIESLVENASAGNALIYWAVECLGLTLALTVLQGSYSGRTPLKFMGLIAVAFLVLILVARAKRLEIVTAIIPLLIVLFARRNNAKVAARRIAWGFAIVAGLVIASAARLSDTLDQSSTAFYLLAEGLYAGHSLPGILERLDSASISPEYGVRFLSALVAFVPRFVWEGKDAMIYAGNIALDGVSPMGATTFLTEVVFQGKYIAVTLCYGIMGFVFERLTRFQEGFDDIKNGAIPARFIGYIIAIAIFVPHFRDGIIPAIKLSLQDFVFLWVLTAPGVFSAFKRGQPTLIA